MKQERNKTSKHVNEKGTPKEQSAYKQEHAHKEADKIKDGFPMGHPDKLKVANANKGNRAKKK